MSTERQKVVDGEASETDDEESEPTTGSLKESIENVKFFFFCLKIIIL